MQPQASTRRLELMRGVLPEQRVASRRSFHLSGTVRLTHGNEPEHIAFTRDMSTAGVFFYSDFEPRVSDELSVTLVVPHGGCLLLQGRVVRVERPRPGAAVGVALLLSSHLFAS